MKHQNKTLIFKTLSLLPNKIGTFIYHKLQNYSENSNVNNKIASSEESYKSFKTIYENLGYQLKGKSIIEIGSGWLPIMPYFFISKGKAKNVHTYDLNEHYQKKAIESFNTLFSTKNNVSISPGTKDKYNLPDTINYFPNQNIIDSNLPPVDVIFSRFVLEHVTPSHIKKMHQKFKDTLPKGTLIIHLISPSDHRAYSDASISLQDFLKYSQSEWDNIQTNFDYHNRLRLPQYLDIFKQIGYEVEHLSFDTTQKDTPRFQQFKALNIHSDYKQYSDEELTAGSIKIVLKV